MDALLHKRAEIVAKIEALKAAHKAEIEDRVAAYKAQLEREYTTPEIEDAKKVLEAIDKVLEYESASNVEQVVEEPIIPQAHIEAAPIVEEKPSVDNGTNIVIEVTKPVAEAIAANTKVEVTSNTRPGMTTIEIPERR